MNEEEFVTNKIYEMTPEEQHELNQKGYVFVWIDKVPHRDGDPSIRKYQFIGRINKNGIKT